MDRPRCELSEAIGDNPDDPRKVALVRLRHEIGDTFVDFEPETPQPFQGLLSIET